MRLRIVLLGLAFLGSTLLTACDRGPKDSPGADVRPVESVESPPPGDSAVRDPAPPAVFDQHVMEDDVARILAEDYGQAGVAAVRCPPEQPVEAGHEFDCEVVADGRPHRVPMRVVDDQRYEVGVPDGIDPP